VSRVEWVLVVGCGLAGTCGAGLFKVFGKGSANSVTCNKECCPGDRLGLFRKWHLKRKVNSEI
jgi:hypothetical protein